MSRDSIIIARYDGMPEAHIAMGRLEAECIEAWLADEHMVQTDWLYSIAVGGIKLLVASRDAQRASKILATDYSERLDGKESI